MRIRSDDTKGWIGSIAIHLLIGLIFFFWSIDFSTSTPDFIEVSWGTVSTVSTSPPPRPSLPGSEGATKARQQPQTRPLDLPERVHNVPDDILPLPRAQKIEVDERLAQPRGQASERSTGTKDLTSGVGLGQKEKFETPGKGETAGEIAESRLSEIAGTDIGKSVSVSMQWSGGGTRKKISGDLPTYPEGVKVEAQIKIEAVVQPDGSVKSLKPAQKGHTRLEEAAMRSVRLWMFEALERSVPQVDQTCLITFNFDLR